MTRFSWDSPCCEACWIDAVGVQRIDEGTTRIRVPLMLKDSGMHTCAFCGELTIVGIFVRRDPATVSFPPVEEEP